MRRNHSKLTASTMLDYWSMGQDTHIAVHRLQKPCSGDVAGVVHVSRAVRNTRTETDIVSSVHGRQGDFVSTHLPVPIPVFLTPSIAISETREQSGRS